MTIRIIDNKKIELTPDEYAMYEQIVKSYTNLTTNGEDLFVDLFETDDNGIILFLKPPKRQTSFEIYLFLINIFQHQHLRIMYSMVNAKIKELDEKLKLIDPK